MMEFLDNFCYTYIDNIIIYFKTEEKYTHYVTAILQRLWNAEL